LDLFYIIIIIYYYLLLLLLFVWGIFGRSGHNFLFSLRGDFLLGLFLVNGFLFGSRDGSAFVMIGFFDDFLFGLRGAFLLISRQLFPALLSR